MQSVAFHTLGCKVNQYETEAMTEQFIKKGYSIVDFNEKADIYIVNTCTVTNIADQKSRKMLAKAKKLNPESAVVAVGCYVQVAHDKLDEMPYIDLMIGNTHKDSLCEIVENYLTEKSSGVVQGEYLELIEDVHHDITYEELKIENQQDKTRTTIKIQDGCDQYCSYCIIPYTRGKVRSREPGAVLEEVEGLVRKGFKEVILTGIHLGSYGKDLEDITLLDLLKDLDKVEGLERVRLGSVEPGLMSHDFVEGIKELRTLCPHFHLSLQSGSDTVLNRMKRRYNTTEYKGAVIRLKEAYDDPIFTTDIIVGFPGETDEEALETEAFVRDIGFFSVHVFKYSIREGTAAAKMKPQINGNVKQQRSESLINLCSEIKHKEMLNRVGSTYNILLEDSILIDDATYMIGYSPNYIRLAIPYDEKLASGCLCEVELAKVPLGLENIDGIAKLIKY